MIQLERVKQRNQAKYRQGAILYLMNRDCRVHDNWALVLAYALAKKYKAPLAVLYVLENKKPRYLSARHYDFLINGLKQTANEFEALNIPLFFETGETVKTTLNFIKENSIGAVVTDFFPLIYEQVRVEKIAKECEKKDIPVFEVDAHNIVPTFFVSPKKEFGAYTIRPKINKLLPNFLTDFPKLSSLEFDFPNKPKKNQFDDVLNNVQHFKNVKPIKWLKAGQKSATETLKNFLQNKLPKYDQLRNDPTQDFQSNLSPYLNFGQISAQRVALEAQKYNQNVKSQESFLEELIVRRELSDNFCFYEKWSFNHKGYPDWAKKSHAEHAHDKREYIYSLSELESAKTHDPLWNAAQKQMVNSGKMHGYMRMYWAKKILEWTPNYKIAHKTAVFLNDKYSLDGCDPNGYTGIAWSIGGVHDRAWFTRNIFGKIRFMSYNGCKSKFDVDKYSSTIFST